MRLTLCGFGLSLVLAGAFSAQSTVTAQEPASPASLAIAGANNFAQYCVACHGKDAKGTGTLAATLKPKPADLTLLTKNNGGTYPRDMVFQVIDGTQEGQGTRRRRHAAVGRRRSWPSAGSDNADAVKRRIDSLVEYLATLQGK